MHKVLSCPADYQTVPEVVQKALAAFPLAIENRRVLIKPNVLRASKAEEGIVTHPAVLKAVVDAVAARSPAALWVGDNPGLFNYGDNENSFETTGLMAAAGGYYRNIGTDTVKVAFNPDYMPAVSLSRAVVDADVIISLPKFKTHGLTVITGAIKNSYGLLPGAQKAFLHKAAGSPERFHRLVVEVFRLRVPDLFIVDAVVGMEGNGPASPDLRDIGMILAGDNAVAVDAVMAVMMGLDPARLPFLQHAKVHGLGDYDMAAIDVQGPLKKLEGFKVPPLGGQAIMENAAIQDRIHSRTVLRPQVDEAACSGCGTCVEHCAVGALTQEGAAIARVDADTCITCFCCQEVCPEKAIALR